MRSGALQLVGGCTRRQNNVGVVTTGQVGHNSSINNNANLYFVIRNYKP